MKTRSSSITIALYALAVCLLSAGAYLATEKLLGLDHQQSTDDAYVTADTTLVAPKVPGFIAAVLVQDNQPVHAGDLLARIDDRDYRAALAAAEAGVVAAKAGLEQADASLQQQQALIAQARATVTAGQADVTFAEHEMDRYSRLAKAGAGSVQSAQQARSKIDSARAHLEFDRAALLAAQRQVGLLQALRDKAGGNLQQAQANLDKARLNLSYTRIIAPIDGVVGARSLRQGAYVNPGSPLLALVPVAQAYVVANFRETQLTHVQDNQPVDIRVDSLPGVHFKGRVQSIAPATGLEFAPIKPSNASGNFTKVVQRIPVKIEFAADQQLLGQLRAGMSVTATIDTAQQQAADKVAEVAVQ